MSKLSHPAPEGVAPGNGYSHVATGPGQWVAIAGQVALDADGNFVGVGDPAAQARQVFANPPASTAVQVSALFSPDALLEVEAYAVV